MAVERIGLPRARRRATERLWHSVQDTRSGVRQRLRQAAKRARVLVRLLILIADVTAVDRLSGEVLLKTEVGGRTVIRAGADLSSAERQAAPLLAENLARNLVSLLVDGAW